MKCPNCKKEIKINIGLVFSEKCTNCNNKIYEKNKVKFKSLSCINVIVCLVLFSLIRNVSGFFGINKVAFDIALFLICFAILFYMQKFLMKILYGDENEKRNSKICMTITIIILSLLVGKTLISLYDEYLCTISIDKVDIKEVIDERMSNVENFKIIETQEEKGYIACLVTYTQYEEELVSCIYLESSNILKNRYYFKGIGDGVARGKMGEYSISSIGNARIIVYGLDLPDNADKYCIDFFEQDKELIVDIHDNKIFELYAIEDDIDNYINCESKLLDSNYNEIKQE